MADNAEFMAELLNRESNPDPLRAALVAIQELHKARFIGTQEDGTPVYACMVCLVDDNGTCKTRRLADDALGGGQDG